MEMYTKDFHQLGQGEYVAIAFNEVLQRIYTTTETTTQKQLAAWLGIPQSFISDAKRRNRIPIAWLRAVVLRGLNHTPEWIMTGTGEHSW